MLNLNTPSLIPASQVNFIQDFLYLLFPSGTGTVTPHHAEPEFSWLRASTLKSEAHPDTERFT